MQNSFGIYDNSYSLIIKAVSECPQIEKAILFGSRAIGNYKKGSDIDIAIIGSGINYEITSLLNRKLNEQLPIPYFVDVLNFNTIDNQQLREHILELGKVIYNK